MLKPQTLKGFRDFLPPEAKKRQYVIDILRSVFESYGFQQMGTPTLEYEELLMGKYGDEGEKLMYRFEDHGKRRVAMRYDQTVPLARFVAQYDNQLPMPFKRYQIQPVWRAENTQKGRFREFMQCDIDTVGTTSVIADAEVIVCAVACVKALGFTDVKILINDRAVFDGMSVSAIATVDKLKKIGEDGVCEELVATGNAKDITEARNLLQSITNQKPTDYLQELFNAIEQFSMDKKYFIFSPTLARGLDYYTKTIFEVEIPDYPVGSVCGGGRYDNLIGMFAGKQIPAVGFAFGFDRLIEAMNELKLFPNEVEKATTKVLITIFQEGLAAQSLKVVAKLRDNKIASEIYLDTKAKLEKQLKYADQKGISYAVILGPEEVAKNTLILKDLRTRIQKELTVDELLQFLQNEK